MTPFTILTNNIKYLGVTLTKQLKHLYEKIFTNPTSNRGLISNIYKELKKKEDQNVDTSFLLRMGYKIPMEEVTESM